MNIFENFLWLKSGTLSTNLNNNEWRLWLADLVLWQAEPLRLVGGRILDLNTRLDSLIVKHITLLKSPPWHLYVLNLLTISSPYNDSSKRKHLYNICSMMDQRRRRWDDVVQMLYKCFVFVGDSSEKKRKVCITWNMSLYTSKNYITFLILLKTPEDCHKDQICYIICRDCLWRTHRLFKYYSRLNYLIIHLMLISHLIGQ